VLIYLYCENQIISDRFLEQYRTYLLSLFYTVKRGLLYLAWWRRKMDWM